ncbi:MAG: hypothetical protein RBS76_01700 [Acholeplasmatales bacterium]|jgi:hypothetical protein|nr:hypothetical protein [Acholeplasmataceae bacterium]MDY0115195.1 hypothetical protein [Acholeplasmatales bacterium]
MIALSKWTKGENKMQLLLLITNHGKADIILKELNNDFDYITSGITFIGKGTAPTEILEFLSLATTEKDVSMVLVKESDLSLILKLIEEKFNFTTKGKGVAFGIKLSSISAKNLEVLRKELLGGKSDE